MSNGQRRTQILTSPAFLFALVTLGVNDWVLKAQFGNLLTGKLSDFAGVFAFVCFGIAVVPVPRMLIAIGTAGGFAWWKLPLSNHAIDLWNSTGMFPVERTVDPTDLFALAVIPVAYAYVDKLRNRPSTRMLRASVAVIAMLLFAGTSSITIVPYTREYEIPVPYARFGELLDSAGLDYYPNPRVGQRFTDSGSIRVPTDYCPQGVWASIRVVENAAGISKVFLVEMSYRCPRKREDNPALLRLFQDSVVLRIQQTARRLQSR